MTATHSSSAAPFMLTVAPSETTKSAMRRETPSFFSTASSVSGSVAPEEAVEKAVASAARSILVSGLGFFAATYGVGLYSNVALISTMCRLIARGALLSVAVVLLLLPAVLLLLDKLIVHTTLDMKKAR